MKKSFLKISSLLFLFVLLISCDKDFNSLDSGVIGDDHFDLELYDDASLVAYSKATGAGVGVGACAVFFDLHPENINEEKKTIAIDKIVLFILFILFI